MQGALQGLGAALWSVLRHPACMVGGLMVFAAAVGIALIFLDPLLVFGAVIGIGAVLIVMREPFLGLLAYTLIFQLRLGEMYPALAPLRVERLVGLLTLAALILAQISRRGRVEFDSSRQTKLMLWLVIAVFTSLPFAFWWEKASEGVVDFLKILIFYMLVVQLVDSRKRLKIFIWLMTGLIAYQASISVYDYFAGNILYAQGIERAIGRTGGVGANELGATMAATIPIFFLYFLDKGMGRWRFFHFAVFGLLLLTLVFTGSRSALLGFIASMGFFSWRSRHRVVFAIVGAVMLVGGFFLLPQQYKGRYETMAQGKLDDSSSLRLVIWGAGLRMMVDRPISGVGINCYGIANGMQYAPPGRNNWMEAHSLYVQVPAEIGFFGAIVFFWFLFEYLRQNRRAAKAMVEEGDRWRFEKILLDALFAGTLALLVTGVFGHSLTRRTWYVYAALSQATLRVYLDVLRAEGRSRVPDLFR